MFTTRAFQRQYFRKNRLLISGFIVSGLVRNISAFLLSVSIGEFFSIYFHSEGSKGKLLQMLGISLSDLHAFFLFFSILILIRGVSGYFDNYLSARQGESFVRALREEIFREQLNWSPEIFGRTHFGKYLLRYTNDMKAVQSYLTRGILGGIRDWTFLLIGFLLLMLISPALSGLYISLAILSILVVMLSAVRQKKYILGSRTERNQLVAHVSRSFQRHGRIHERERQEKTVSKFERISAQLFHANIDNHRYESLMQSLFAIMQFLMIGIIFWAMAGSALFAINVSDALVFILIILLMNSTLKRVLKIPSYLQKGKLSLERIERIMNFKAVAAEEPDDAALIPDNDE